MKKISIIIPAYNERDFIGRAIEAAAELDCQKEIIVVDDCSIDGTREILKNLQKEFKFKLLVHQKNQGKGAAIRTGLKEAQGAYSIVYDADLEYQAKDILFLLKEMEKIQKSSLREIAVYGSRFLKNYSDKFSLHYLANCFLTFLTNRLFGLNLTDMETCLKLCPTKILKELGLTAKRFEFEPEVTAKLAKRGVVIIERPIHYSRRTYQQGKKIRFRDGVMAIKTLIRERFKV
ncbi:MAG: hypothetical protein A3I88_02000 [Candidatus Portnoybacteria bacterium RIFCSPLOWO2_12_FULL_39_9]|uniref:Glycosyltransferase 2-like domain-containing protein n=1 Tax=Candidatus Portnoybacteria bacterium RIFCSPHIGHO2_12_FULL_38_9 TaxID=1801997 RepID=A0A1G2FEF1_9BACT|nr:MAG: hypothetical protein A3H00_00545 [Candidatus Portnoybacteria bacterium RBG_13_40_8]OGZ36177.1 MAG: hypothetical protein A3J64_00220 [Candidatus Portnoybacteria bacterium RIFCSPHIGHO2_12_FULL_38_9]OGZ37203.1 MAG: hypothetical protein A2646_03390 [Candidatus Portnoybacteria bacterium RIFCSPHIGHO2_02_FULL_39_12]OGZ38583.1 MAG: hypothetical protein A3F21_01140 [Candidatus Portnoybacteria bacterium RIFCSPLOWO2_01_FULL_38_39]OGZ41223.1 MAG: hypothetical protein A3I88_02000 [Candidatus Portnoy